MDAIAKRYVQLTLAVGQHDAHYVDAYYGPEEWRPDSMTLPEIQYAAVELRELLGEAPSGTEAMEVLRWRYLAKQLEALLARVSMLQGNAFTFDDESFSLYDVVDAGRSNDFYLEALASLEPYIPGKGPLSERFEDYRRQFTIPSEKVDAVFSAAIAEARRRTKEFVELEEHENFRVEYVTGEVWSAYNWYQGNAHSLIQVNTDFPISIDRAIDLAAHEGYPGHHVYNALLEQHLMRGRGWMEFSVYALFSPQSLIAEGTAEYGIELAFPKAERLAFEKEVLYPLAGIDPSLVEPYAEVRDLLGRLGWASNDAARQYLDGHATREETIDWVVAHALSSRDRAEQRLRFIEANRSYVVTYNVGKKLVKQYIEGLSEDRAGRWTAFIDLLSSPRLPSALV